MTLQSQFERTNYSEMACRIMGICRDAQDKQKRFLKHCGITIEDARAMSAAQQKHLNTAFEVFE